MKKSIQIGVGGIFHETNSFAPGKTTIEDFKRTWIDNKETFMNRFSGTQTSMGGTIDAAKNNGVYLIPSLYTETTPSGIVSGDDIEELINSLVDSISNSLDGLILILHGAMISEKYLDVEAEILLRLREKLGNSMPIAVTLDLHANISETLVENSSFIVGYDTYPHIDSYERAIEAMEILIATIRKQLSPSTAWLSSDILIPPQTMITDKGPMKELMDYAFEIEEDPEVLNVTVSGGFPFSDVPDIGMSFVVTTNDNKNTANKYVNKLVEKSLELKDKFIFDEISVEEAAEWTVKQKEGPIIWVEGSDNVGGGAPADATHVLKHLIDFQEKSLIVMRDEQVANKAHQLGVGEIIEDYLGGKSDDLHGSPVKIKGKIKLLSDGEFTFLGPFMGGKQANMGKTAVVEVNNVTIAITEYRMPPFDINHVNSIGINPRDYKVIVVKSAVAWKTSFGNISKGEVYLDTPGCCSANLHHFKYKNIKSPIYPFSTV